MTTEKQFESHVKELAKMFNYLYYHTHRSMHSPAGFPDCVMVRTEPEPRIIFAELKAGDNQPTVEQWMWLYILQHIPQVECYLWHESEFEDIAEVMR